MNEKQTFYLGDPVKPLLWFTYPEGRRTATPELNRLIQLYYFPN